MGLGFPNSPMHVGRYKKIALAEFEWLQAQIQMSPNRSNDMEKRALAGLYEFLLTMEYGPKLRSD